MALEYEDVRHRYGSDDVLHGVSFVAAAGEVTCLLGRSGSGKSTLLRLAAGLERLQSGTVRLDGEVLGSPSRHPPPEQRPVGLVFQDHVLFPHKTAEQNIAFGLRGASPQTRRDVAARHLASVGLAGFAHRYPDTLSGGEQQRVALARALAPSPKVMLLDEPFANVDATLRRALREDARAMLRLAGSVALIVTHDPDEALELADRIVVLGEGRVVQAGTPAEIWRHPADLRVAEMFGEAQHLRGDARDGVAYTSFGAIEWGHGTGPVDVVARPAGVALTPAPEGPSVADIRFLGDRYFVLLQVGEETLRASVADLRGISVGDRVAMTFDPAATFVYPRGK